MGTYPIPSGSTHVFVNTKNKKSWYLNRPDGSWEIYNKGLDTWEKIPSLDLAIIPVDVYLNSEASTEFLEIEDATLCVTSVTNKVVNNKHAFIEPPISPEDYLFIYGLFQKYSKGTPLGFINGEENYSVFYDHKMSKWYISTSWNVEHLSVYSTNRSAVMKVVDELNTSLLTTI